MSGAPVRLRAHVMVGDTRCPLIWVPESDMDEKLKRDVTGIPRYIDLRRRVWPKPAEGLKVEVTNDT